MEKLAIKKVRPISGRRTQTAFLKTSSQKFSSLGSSHNSQTQIPKIHPQVLPPPHAVGKLSPGPLTDRRAVVEAWIGLEERIVHDYKAQKRALPESPKKRSWFGLFSLPEAKVRVQAAAIVPETPAPKAPSSRAPEADHSSTKTWVALEEKIIHDYEASASKAPSSRVPQADPSSKSWVALEEKIVHDYKAQECVRPAVQTKRTFWGFFLFRNTEVRVKAVKPPKAPASKTPAPKALAPKAPSSRVPPADLSAVSGWVALEEKIVHEYRPQPEASVKRAAAPVPSLPKQPPVLSEVFTTRTTAAPVPSAKPKAPLFRFTTAFPGVSGVPGILIWIAAGTLVFLYAQGLQSRRELTRQFIQLQVEKEQIEQAYAELKGVSEHQAAEVKWLNNRVRAMDHELKAAERKTAAAERTAEKKYRQELNRVTDRYEVQLEDLRKALHTKESIIEALKAQLQALEGLSDPGGIAAVSGAASRIFSSGSAVTPGFSGRSRVFAVNVRQGYFVIEAGAEQGLRYGDKITVSGRSAGSVVGRVDRIYPTLSTVTVADTQTLSGILEGDAVSFR